MKYVNSICNTCKLEGTCLDDPMEDCKDYRETDEARKSRIEAEVKAHDERVLREFIKWLCENYTVLDNHNEEVSADDLLWECIAERLKEQK